MAGADWKTYATGDLIDATTFQTFIQDQVIQVYADSSARDTALGTSDAEGMFCFLKDSNTLQFYDGSAWVNFIGEGDITGVTAGDGRGCQGQRGRGVSVDCASVGISRGGGDGAAGDGDRGESQYGGSGSGDGAPRSIARGGGEGVAAGDGRGCQGQRGGGVCVDSASEDLTRG